MPEPRFAQWLRQIVGRLRRRDAPSPLARRIAHAGLVAQVARAVKTSQDPGMRPVRISRNGQEVTFDEEEVVMNKAFGILVRFTVDSIVALLAYIVAFVVVIVCHTMITRLKEKH